MREVDIKNYTHTIGIDEVGTGALAGPVYVCAFVAPHNFTMEGLTDSKKLSEKSRENLKIKLKDNYNYSIVSAHPNDEKLYEKYGNNLHSLLKFLYWQAVNNLNTNHKSLIILDGNIKFPEIPHKLFDSISMPKADLKIPHVSAASVLAKVERDSYMEWLDKYYPNYNWKENKGYPTAEHLSALEKFGIVEEHRKNYKPVKKFVK